MSVPAPLNLRRPFGSAAHEAALRSINRVLQAAGRRAAPVAPAAAAPAAETVLLDEAQQQALEGVAMMLAEIHKTAREINIQAAAFGLPLPRLVLAEAASYNGLLYGLAHEASIAARKCGGNCDFKRLRRLRRLEELKTKVLKTKD